MRAARAVAEARVPALSTPHRSARTRRDRRTGRWTRAIHGRRAELLLLSPEGEVERRLTISRPEPDVRVVRMRQALTFKREAAEGQRRLFGGPLFPNPFARPSSST
jgi:hypothetical protein